MQLRKCVGMDMQWAKDGYGFVFGFDGFEHPPTLERNPGGLQPGRLEFLLQYLGHADCLW